MGLLAGIAAVVVTIVVTAGFSSLFGFDLYWLGAGAWAVWAGVDSRKHALKRFERVFPLEPLALGLSVLIVWPIALPWYLRLRRMALRGELSESAGPSRAKHMLVGVVIAGTLVGVGAQLVFTRSSSYRTLMHLVTAVQRASPDPTNVTMHSGGGLSVTVFNSRIAAVDTAARREEARRLAVVVAQALPDTHAIGSIDVGFTKAWRGGGLSYTRGEGTYTWAAQELR